MIKLSLEGGGFTMQIGRLKKGERNAITDVPGIKVGHCTIDSPDHQTGVTVILPCADDIFKNKMVAACHVLNGFGKTAGLVQIEELGTLETPIALTNTLNVGLVHDSIVEYMCQQAEKNNYSITSINPIVCECNDSILNDIRHRAIGTKEVFQAIASANTIFEEGSVGAGRGMSCHGLKGGIGTSSRKIEINNQTFILGVLVLTNHGCLEDLMINGNNIGADITKKIQANASDKGSCIMVVATNLPVTDRQLKRIIKRCSVGLARMGSFIGHGSGEIMIGFSTANRIPESGAFCEMNFIHESQIDLAFRAAAEATEEAVLHSMLQSPSVIGYQNNIKKSLTEFL